MPAACCISCDPQNVARIQQVAVKYGLSAEQIGSTVPDQLEIRVDGKAAATASVSELREAWDGALERALHVETEERLVPGDAAEEQGYRLQTESRSGERC